MSRVSRNGGGDTGGLEGVEGVEGVEGEEGEEKTAPPIAVRSVVQEKECRLRNWDKPKPTQVTTNSVVCCLLFAVYNSFSRSSLPCSQHIIQETPNQRRYNNIICLLEIKFSKRTTFTSYVAVIVDERPEYS